jgi:hypothetical protein
MPLPFEIEDWEEFLTDQGCSQVQDMGSWVMVKCFFHEQSDTNRPSLGINKESGVGNCFGCGTHYWDEMCEVWGISSADYIDAVRSKRWERFIGRVRGETGLNRPYLRFKLPKNLVSPFSIKESKEYFVKRGILEAVLEEYGVKVCMDKGSKYHQHIIFPISDRKGVLYFDARYIGANPNAPRWRCPDGAARSKTFFNWRYEERGLPYLCFVEGASDALKLITWGLKYTIPAKHFSTEQFKMILNSGVERLFLAYDQDDAGRYKLNKKGENVSFEGKAKRLFEDCGREIRVVRFPGKAKDAGDVRDFNSFIEENLFLRCYVDGAG